MELLGRWMKAIALELALRLLGYPLTIAYVLSILSVPFGSAMSLPDQHSSDGIESTWFGHGSNTASKILNVISYLPIALYAENLRVRKALIMSVSTDCSIAPALTGCAKDLHTLLDVDEWDLFDDFGASKNYSVASLRHGNSFPSANRGLLELAGLIDTKNHRAGKASDANGTPVGQVPRQTTVSVNFVTQSGLTGLQGPGNSPPWLSGFCQAATIAEIVLLLTLTVIMAFFQMIRGSLLTLSMVIKALVLFSMHYKCSPIFANVRSMRADLEKTAENGAALDVQIISSSWNSSHLDVLCGYSSQLHSLTNLPVRVSNAWVIPTGCRILAVSLLAQGALLMSLTGESDINATSLIRSLNPNVTLQRQPGVVNSVVNIGFNGRRAALCFIAMLPVTSKVGRWDWLDPFMPPNERRREWQEEMETCGLICRVDPRVRSVSTETQRNIEEALAAYRNPELSKYLFAYKQSVRAT